MTSYETKFGSLQHYHKGGIEIIDGDPKHFAFSNMFEVAASATPWEQVAVGKNMEYVLEVIRAEGTSGWRTCAHDQFALVVDGEATVELVHLDTPLAAAEKNGSIALPGDPPGAPMGHIVARRGHQALLPAHAAYRFVAARTSVILMQTLLGDDTVQRWADICLS